VNLETPQHQASSFEPSPDSALPERGGLAGRKVQLDLDTVRIGVHQQDATGKITEIELDACRSALPISPPGRATGQARDHALELRESHYGARHRLGRQRAARRGMCRADELSPSRPFGRVIDDPFELGLVLRGRAPKVDLAVAARDLRWVEKTLAV